MYKVLVCDDEKWIRKGVMKKIEEMSLPISSIFEAEDIEKAKGIIEKECPHIVIADICMGEENGLDFIDGIICKYPDIKFIIISGYSEFEYAKRAIKLGVISYILKPITPEDLKQALIKAIEKYKTNKDLTLSKNAWSELSYQNTNYQIEIIFNQIFRESNAEYQSQLVAQAKKIHRDWKKYCRLILLQIENSSYENSSFSKQETELLKYGVKNIVSELAENDDENIEIIRDTDHLQRMIIIVWGDDFNKISLRSMQFVTQISYVIREELNVSLTIALSPVHNDIAGNMYTQAQKAMHNKFIDGINKIYVYPENPNEAQNIRMPHEQFALLEKCLKKNDGDSAKKIIHEIFSEDNKTARNSEYTLCIYLSILNVLLNSFEEAVYIFNNSKFNFTDINYFERFEDNKQIEEFFDKIITQLCSVKEYEESAADCKSLMNKVKEYIDSNYMNKISLSELAKLFNINYSYFSTIFKEEAGIPLTQYLRTVRIEKACSMLKESGTNIKIIANSVGFDDTMYFYRVFKKSTGVTPSEYRKKYE